MLIKEFYEILNLTSSGSEIKAIVNLFPSHEVYKGHFPHQPVVPGVIQLQIAKEILEKILKTRLFMGNIIQVKYLVPISPVKNSQITFIITNKYTDEEKIKSSISIGFNNTTFTKAQIEFSIK